MSFSVGNDTYDIPLDNASYNLTRKHTMTQRQMENRKKKKHYLNPLIYVESHLFMLTLPLDLSIYFITLDI